MECTSYNKNPKGTGMIHLCLRGVVTVCEGQRFWGFLMKFLAFWFNNLNNLREKEAERISDIPTYLAGVNGLQITDEVGVMKRQTLLRSHRKLWRVMIK